MAGGFNWDRHSWWPQQAIEGPLAWEYSVKHMSNHGNRTTIPSGCAVSKPKFRSGLGRPASNLGVTRGRETTSLLDVSNAPFKCACDCLKTVFAGLASF